MNGLKSGADSVTPKLQPIYKLVFALNPRFPPYRAGCNPANLRGDHGANVIGCPAVQLFSFTEAKVVRFEFEARIKIRYI